MIPINKRVTVIYWNENKQVTLAGYFMVVLERIYWKADRHHDWRLVCYIDDIVSVRVD